MKLSHIATAATAAALTFAPEAAGQTVKTAELTTVSYVAPTAKLELTELKTRIDRILKNAPVPDLTADISNGMTFVPMAEMPQVIKNEVTDLVVSKSPCDFETIVTVTNNRSQVRCKQA